MKTTTKSLSVGLLIAALALTGCSTGGGSDSSGGIDPAVKKAAQAQVDKYQGEPQARQPETLSAKPPTGKEAVAISCPLPICTEVTGLFVEATKDLGWDTRVIVPEFTPESYVSAFESAIQLHPDYLYYIATQPNDVITTQLEKAKAAGIPVIVNSPAPDTKIGGDSPQVAAVAGANQVKQYSELMADIVVADAKDLDHITYMYDPASPAYVYQYQVFSDRIKAAGGKVAPFEINQGDAGATLLGQITSYLQRTPDTEYFVTAHDNLIIGLPDAIATAGLESPKIIGQNPGKDNIEYLKKGTEFATVQWGSFDAHWDAADLFARLSVGDSIDSELNGSVMVGTKKNADQIPLTTFPGIPDNYLKAWRLK